MSVDYAAQILEGSHRAAARLISWLEDEDERAYECMRKLYPHTGRAYVVGITGSPGAGKSTLTTALTRVIRKSGLKVGIIAVDPSSPFTGGALLGDRVRMSELADDPDIYIRSMATRGFLGGMAKAAADVVRVLDALGKDVIVIETVGVGQDEVDIVGVADTTCVVMVPGLGDAIQSMKAGIMEIADVFVINKADHPGSDMLCAEICARLDMDAQLRERGWVAPVNKTVAVEGVGLDEMWLSIESHRKYLLDSGRFYDNRRERISREALRMIHGELFRVVREQLEQNGRLDAAVEQLMNRKLDPYTLMRDIVTDWLSSSQCKRRRDEDTQS
ncbi:MAG: methylmalonyl Co-A mutase-associated GTPase MeaB [Deltaproteobacteria bacterium]|jgi:LAO/AO transport system kinase|nr:methylmalonyl Co-A mutase-associated GTPase MeaB [Deltaproteobacteria bacterium]MDA8305766.1 methylmalonyl Co-A mutase-associated GTPase MeaB [Deltaproteobacteria bacterium]